jgi:uncharacterized protein (UPF0218 family)
LFAVSKLILPESQRELLKEPLGQLVIGTPSECNQTLKDTQASEKPPLLVLVGDTISRNAIQFGIRPDVIIIDNKEMREEAQEFSHGKSRVFRSTNEPATINFLAWQAVAEAIESGDGVVLVNGEEDLLTLVAILVAPVGSIVAYGQPEKGIVLVRISDKKKDEIQSHIDRMKKID